MHELDFLPEAWDADELGALLLEHLEEINAYLKTDMGDALRLFTIEELVDQDELHDDAAFITISFGQEGVAAFPDSRFKKGWGINPRDVITSLALALKILDDGWGIDPYMVIGTRTALRMTSVEYMTLDWQGSVLYPAFRYPVETAPISRDTVAIIVSIIRSGRGKGQYRGRGIIKAAR